MRFLLNTRASTKARLALRISGVVHDGNDGNWRYAISRKKKEKSKRNLRARYNEPLSRIKYTTPFKRFLSQVSDITMINSRVLKSSSAPHNAIMRYKGGIFLWRKRSLAHILGPEFMDH